jgi:glycosyltransferase involved in cell wall biosynthesis
VLAAIAEHGLQDVVTAPGFVAGDEVDSSLARALCLLHPSQREGYGLVVVESAAAGVPSVLAAGPDNAATELIEEGVNGFVAASAAPSELADAIVRVHEAGPALRASTAAWFEAHAHELSVESSLDRVVEAYSREQS